MSSIHLTIATLISLFMPNNVLGLGYNQKDSNLIDSTCKQTQNYQLCETILRKDPRSSTADVAGLGLVAVDALKAKTIEILQNINGLKKSRSDLSHPLNECAQNYGIVLKYDITQAVEALTKGDPKFAEDGVADAAFVAQKCEGSFEKSKSPLTNLNQAIEDIANIARAIIRQLL